MHEPWLLAGLLSVFFRLLVCLSVELAVRRYMKDGSLKRALLTPIGRG